MLNRGLAYQLPDVLALRSYNGLKGRLSQSALETHAGMPIQFWQHLQPRLS